MLGLRCCARAFSLVVVCGGLLFIVVRGLFVAVASLVAEHGLLIVVASHCGGFSLRIRALGAWASVVWHAGSVAVACGL